MSENNAVETAQVAAPVQEAISNTVVAPVEQDILAKYNALQEKAIKLERDRDNYRKGMLKAKGKLPEQEVIADDEVDLDSKINSAVDARIKAAMADTELYQAREEAEQLARLALQENAELKRALAVKASRPTTMTSAGAASDMSNSSPKSYWSDEQLAAMKAMGVDPQKAYENVLKTV